MFAGLEKLSIDAPHRKDGENPESPSALHISELPQVIGLVQLPYDVHREIFDYLNPAQAVCLGLTCKTLYNVNQIVKYRVSLFTRAWDSEDNWYLIPQLSDLLKEWMAPKYVWSIYRRKFITHEANWRDLDDIGRWWPESGIGTKIGDSEESALVEDEVKNKARDKALNQLLGN